MRVQFDDRVKAGTGKFGDEAQLGGIFVSRLNTDRTSDYNLTYGLDGRLGVGQSLSSLARILGPMLGLTLTDYNNVLPYVCGAGLMAAGSLLVMRLGRSDPLPETEADA